MNLGYDPGRFAEPQSNPVVIAEPERRDQTPVLSVRERKKWVKHITNAVYTCGPSIEQSPPAAWIQEVVHAAHISVDPLFKEVVTKVNIYLFLQTNMYITNTQHPL